MINFVKSTHVSCFYYLGEIINTYYFKKRVAFFNTKFSRESEFICLSIFIVYFESVTVIVEEQFFYPENEHFWIMAMWYRGCPWNEWFTLWRFFNFLWSFCVNCFKLWLHCEKNYTYSTIFYWRISFLSRFFYKLQHKMTIKNVRIRLKGYPMNIQKKCSRVRNCQWNNVVYIFNTIFTVCKVYFHNFWDGEFKFFLAVLVFQCSSRSCLLIGFYWILSKCLVIFAIYI